MRALYIVNPQATTTTSHTRDVIARALESRLDLDLVETESRGHGRKLAQRAAEEGYELIVALGGDGTVNEIVNGVLEAPGTDRPALAVLPGGSANVFARGLGSPAHPVKATVTVLDRLRSGSRRTIGLGRVSDGQELRYFTFSAGFGWDAAVIREIDRQRSAGYPATPRRYVAAALRLFATDESIGRATLSLDIPGRRPSDDLYLALVTNTTPWTYAGRFPLQPTPRSRLESGLDIFALTRFDTLTVAAAVGKMVSRRGAPPRGRGHISRHDEDRFTIRAGTPSPCHVDGEYLGLRERLDFSSVPKALQVIA